MSKKEFHSKDKTNRQHNYRILAFEIAPSSFKRKEKKTHRLFGTVLSFVKLNPSLWSSCSENRQSQAADYHRRGARGEWSWRAVAVPSLTEFLFRNKQDWVNLRLGVCLCVLRTFLQTTSGSNCLNDSQDILSRDSALPLHYAQCVSVLDAANVHRLQLQVHARWRTRLLPSVLHLFQSSG